MGRGNFVKSRTLGSGLLGNYAPIDPFVQIWCWMSKSQSTDTVIQALSRRFPLSGVRIATVTEQHSVFTAQT